MDSLLKVTGLVAAPKEFGFADLAGLDGQVPDVGRQAPGREGGAVRLDAVLEAVRPLPGARYVTLSTGDGSFSASVLLESIRQQGLVLYRLGNSTLPEAKGGPLRFLIANVEACGTGDVDRCANVKFLSSIHLSETPGRDLRPATRKAHEDLHARPRVGRGPLPRSLPVTSLSHNNSSTPGVLRPLEGRRTSRWGAPICPAVPSALGRGPLPTTRPFAPLRATGWWHRQEPALSAVEGAKG